MASRSGSSVSESSATRPFRFRRAGHIVIRCADAERTARFLRDVVGLKQYGTVARGMHFLASDFADNHHQVLVRPAKPGAPSPEPDARIGFARVAFEMKGADAVAALRSRLAANGTALENAEHPGGVAFRDPDGNLFEFYCGDGRGPDVRGAEPVRKGRMEKAS